MAKTESLQRHFANTNGPGTGPTPGGGISWLEKQAMASEVAEVAAVNAPTAPMDPEATASAITEGLTAQDPNGLNVQTMSLKEMTQAAQPILDIFESIRVSVHKHPGWQTLTSSRRQRRSCKTTTLR